MKILRFSPNLAVVAGWLVAIASLTVYAGAPQAAEYRSLLVGTRTGSVLVDPATGAVSGTLPAAYAQDVRAGRLYLAANNRELRIYDLNGELQKTIRYEPVAQAIGLVVIGDGRIAVLDNKDDYVRFLDPSGASLATVPIPGAGGSSLQNLHGIVVGGELVVSENGRKAVFAIDLENYSARILKDLSGEVGGAWLSGIACLEGAFYVAKDKGELYRFRADGPAELFAAGFPKALTGLLAGDGALYATSLHAGEVYRIALDDGSYTVIAEGLDRPRTIDGVP